MSSFTPSCIKSSSSIREASSSGGYMAGAGVQASPHSTSLWKQGNSTPNNSAVCQQQNLAFSELQLVFSPSGAGAGTKASQTARVTFKHKHKLPLQNFPHCSKYDINEVHQAFSIKMLDGKVVSCLRQRRLYSSISKPSILASTKWFTSQRGRPVYSTKTLFNMGKLQIGWCICHVKVDEGF